MLLTAGAYLEGVGWGIWIPPSWNFQNIHHGKQPYKTWQYINLCPMTRSRKLAQYLEYHSKDYQNERCIGHTSGNALQYLVADTGDPITGGRRIYIKFGENFGRGRVQGTWTVQSETISADCMLFFFSFFVVVAFFCHKKRRCGPLWSSGAQLYIQGGWCSLLHMGSGPTWWFFMDVLKVQVATFFVLPTAG